MHIPDGFIDPKISTGFAFAAIGVLSICISKVRAAITEKVPVAQKAWAAVGNQVSTMTTGWKTALTKKGEQKLMLIGMVTSLIFAVQMFNFPIQSGTSGHLIGGMLAAALLGPWAGILAVTAVVVIQAVFYADGGLIVLGANIFNMAIIGVGGAYIIYKPLKRFSKSIALIAGAWCSVMLAALATSLGIGLSGVIELSKIIPAMLSVHALIGIAEGLITVVLVSIAVKVLPAFKEEVQP